MFTSHKGKVYRSNNGCCICKAKSSSSRFTRSSRFKREFPVCFQISEEEAKRSDDICNACVLLVKRWKKLPKGSKKDWRHVVGAREGPGTKKMKKIKIDKKKAEAEGEMEEKKPKDKPDDILDDVSDRSFQSASSDSCSDDDAASMKSTLSGSKKRKMTQPRKIKPNGNTVQFSSFLDRAYWKRKAVCCGIVYEGAHRELAVDPSLMRPCICRAKAPATPPLSQQNASENGDQDDEEGTSATATCGQDGSQDKMATVQSGMEQDVDMNEAPPSPALTASSDDEYVDVEEYL